MPSSGAFSVLRLRAPRLHRDESSVTTKNSKLHESIRIQAFAHRLELRLQTRDLRAHLAPELNLHVLRVPSTCFSLLRRIISLLRRNYLPVIVLFRVHRNSQAGVSLISNSFRENAWRRAIFRDVGWGNMSQRMDDSPARDSRPGHRAAARD